MLNKTDIYAVSSPGDFFLPSSSMLPTLNGNTTSVFYKKPPLGSRGLVGVLVSFYLLVTTCALGSNCTILISVIRRLVPRNTVNIFFSSLAISDLIMVILSCLDCYAYLNGGWVFGEVACKIQSLLLEVSFTASTFTLVAVSCERYLLICHPRMKRRTLRNIYFMLLWVWLASFFITSPLLHGYIVHRSIDEDAETVELICANKGWSKRYRLIYYSTFSFFTYVLPLFIMAFTHWRIATSVRDNHRRQKHSQNTRFFDDIKPSVCFTVIEESSGGSSDLTAESNDLKPSNFHKLFLPTVKQLKRNKSGVERESKRQDRRIKAVRMLLVVTVTFFILWTPFIVMRVIVLAGKDINYYVYKFSEVLILSSTAVNAFIYAYMSPPFRKAFKAILCCQAKDEILQRYTGTTASNSEEPKSAKKSSRSNFLSQTQTMALKVKNGIYEDDVKCVGDNV